MRRWNVGHLAKERERKHELQKEGGRTGSTAVPSVWLKCRCKKGFMVNEQQGEGSQVEEQEELCSVGKRETPAGS